jgi:hypothetical protein
METAVAERLRPETSSEKFNRICKELTKNF